jgi:hypothetical protein
MQTTLCVPLDVKPESTSRLSALIDDLRQQEDNGKFAYDVNFGRVIRDIPTLHFMSISVFTAADYDPMFVFEANMDGPPGVFWGQIEAAFGEKIRDMLRCCKQPLDSDAALYQAVTAPGSVAPVAAYMEARTQWPSAFHHGNRGMSRDRILTEAALFGELRTELDDPARHSTDVYRGLAPMQVHQKLREALQPKFAWLASDPPPRIPDRERARDIARLMLFVVVLLLVLSLPGVIVAALLPAKTYLLLILVLAAILAGLLYLVRKPLPGTEVPTSFKLVEFLGNNAVLIIWFLGAAVILTTAVMWPMVMFGSMLLSLLEGTVWSTAGLGFWHMAGITLRGLLSLVVILPLIVLWLRYLEKRDSSQAAPPFDPTILREMARQEDWVAQNHMGSIVLIKPGVLRTILLRAGHLGLGLLLRVTATNGYLGSMRTVHFAHWAFLNNGSRLLFLSNFDQSWGSYLDDFIEKASVGTTLAWGAGVGFPPTRFLIYDGSSNGRMFKNWALASRAVSRFWFSAYPGLTVNQIERNNRLADGLRKPGMTEEEARTWMLDL